MSMLHPSYKEMIEKMNEDTKDREDAVEISSRYSLVIAAAKRARQINAGAEPFVDASPKDRNLSVAVKEIFGDKVHIIKEEAAEKAYEEKLAAAEAMIAAEEAAARAAKEAEEAEKAAASEDEDETEEDPDETEEDQEEA